MDPPTVITILALNLVAIGAVLAMIGRRMDDTQGMRDFATGSVVFGLAYLLRLATGHAATNVASVLPDTAMVYATLCYATGLRQFSGRAPLGRHAITLWAGGFAVASLACTLAWQGVGRHAVLNAALAFNYLWLAVVAQQGSRRVAGTLRIPLRVLALIIGTLGGLTALRSLAALAWGEAPLFKGLPAQLYYGYSTIVTVVLGPNLLWMVFVRLNDTLARLATHDPLTGLLNRNGLDAALDRHFGQRPPPALVLCHLDIDHFKRINDSQGHAVGDTVLQGVARTLAAQVRAGDFVARLGGEEFLLGCAGVDQAQALALAERLRSAMAQQQHALPDGGALACTASIGVSQPVADRHSWELALRGADAALYAAKDSGRNRVMAASPAGPAGSTLTS